MPESIPHGHVQASLENGGSSYQPQPRPQPPAPPQPMLSFYGWLIKALVAFVLFAAGLIIAFVVQDAIATPPSPVPNVPTPATPTPAPDTRKLRFTMSQLSSDAVKRTGRGPDPRSVEGVRTPVFVNFVVTNTGDEVAAFCKAVTPLSSAGLTQSNIIDVLDVAGTHELGYRGKFVYTTADGRIGNDCVTIPPGGHISNIIDLSNSFHFEPKKSYHLYWNPIDALEPVDIYVEGNHRNKKFKADTTLQKYTRCDAAQKAEIEKYVPQSKAAALAAIGYVGESSKPKGKKRFEKWFGVHANTPKIRTYLKTSFQLIADTLDDANYICYSPGDEGYEEDTFAAVFPDDPNHTIEVNGAFFNCVGEACPFEKVNTFIHEVTHFNSVMGTDDILQKWANPYGCCQRDTGTYSISDSKFFRGIKDQSCNGKPYCSKNEARYYGTKNSKSLATLSSMAIDSTSKSYGGAIANADNVAYFAVDKDGKFRRH